MRSPPVVPLHPWKWPTRVFQRVHVDFAEKTGDYFFILVDSYSKWIKVAHMRSTTTEKTIEVLRSWVSRFGLPETLCSDNGPQFIAKEFALFLKRNGVRHILVPPYHRASNGAAERLVQIVKMALLKEIEKVKQGGKNLPMGHRLANFLIRYRITPHSVTGQTPSELFLGRRARTIFSVLVSNLEEHVVDKQWQQKYQHDRSRVKFREFEPNNAVCVKDYSDSNSNWSLGTVVKCMGPTSYLVRVGRSLRHVHVDHLLKFEGKKGLTEPENAVLEKPGEVYPPVGPRLATVPKDSVDSPIVDTQ
ncbi:PREDICTED: uncharacterized protein K02A2.6-like [Priapulus caudatus]|uniref:Uncharacterized protein K02A2.6-like n=1 Tax=Priapulus caudatus TaxID=37621 RepID=A0ABM1F073_PRICU|nr:PREDICTED: uncharacterized protein K02A2.6-like [Priapulus caudatus]